MANKIATITEIKLDGEANNVRVTIERRTWTQPMNEDDGDNQEIWQAKVKAEEKVVSLEAQLNHL